MTAPYVELQVLTHFSLLRGASSPDELFAAAAMLGYPAIGVSDIGTVAGVVRAWEAQKATGVRSIAGTRVDLSCGRRLILYPTDRPAWSRITRLLTVGKKRAGKGGCLLHWHDLEPWSEGIIAILLPGEADQANLAGLADLKSVYGRRGYMALFQRRRPDDAVRIDALASQAGGAGVRAVATGDVLYHAPEARLLQDVVTAVREKCTVDELGYRREVNADRALKSPEEMVRRFRDYPDALRASVDIARACTFDLGELAYQYPHERLIDGLSAQDALQKLATDAVERMFDGKVPAAYTDQIGHEMRLIGELGYAPYFLTVYAIVREARRRGILCQGRGSAANSCVCFVLGVTSIDPIKHELLFERFVSGERREPPDIDVDFEHERREEIIQWIYKTYGRDRSALTAVVQRYRARGAVRDVGKALGLPEDLTSSLAGLVWGWSAEDVGEKQVQELNLDIGDRRLRLTLELARKLIGVPRHMNTATVQYSRSVALPLVGSSLLTAYASSSDVDRRIGLSVSFFRAVDRKTSLSFSGGGQYVSGNGDGARNGPSPVAEAVVTRTQQIGSVDVISQAGATTDADSNRLFAQARANSSFGALDTTVQYQTRNAGNSGLTYIGNLQTGIAIGGGAVKIGLRSPADSMVIVDLRNLTSATKKGDAVVVSTADAPEATSENLAVADGGYRITVNDKAFDYIAPGKRVAIGLPALKQYRVGLKPEGAPQFDIDAAQRAVTLYPGNVVTLRFEAKRVVTIFGQILDPSGSPVASARVEAGSDVALADDQGYFTITAPLAAAIDIVRPGGATCLRRPLASLIDPRQPSLLYRVGKLVCASAVTTPKRTGEAQPIATDRADRAAGSSPLPTTIERVPFLPAETSGSALPPSPLLGASLPTFRELADVARGAIARITEATPKERSSPISTPQPPIAAATRTSGMDEEDFATPIDVVALPRATLSSIPPEPAKSVEALIAAARLAIERLSPTKIA